MSTQHTTLTDVTQSSAATPPTGTLYTSPGVKSVLANLADNRKSNILDLGKMNQHNVAFFSGYNCKLFVEDIAPSLDEIHSGGDIDEYLLNYGEETQFDAIFAWDIFNYLDLPHLIRLISRIKKNCRSDTLMHVMVYTDDNIADTPRHFALHDGDALEVAQANAIKRKFPQYSAFDLLSHLPQFVAQDTWLPREGMLPGTMEYTFRFNPRRLRPVRALGSSPEKRSAERDSADNETVHRSPGLAHIFQHIDAVENGARVLDLGSPVDANIRAFKSTGSEIYVENLTRAVGGLDQQSPSLGGRSNLGSHMLDYRGEDAFDVILVWDIFNYLQLNQVEVMANKLRDICKDGSKLFSLAYTHKTMPASPRRFAIGDNHCLTYSNTPGQLRSIPYFTTLDLLKRMRGFAIEKTYLLQDGMQSGITELVISYKG